MSSTVTALFDTRADAEAAKMRLQTAQVDVGHINIHDKASSGISDTGYSTHQNRGMWDTIKHAFLPDEDRHTYEEGVRRGGVLLTADVDDDRVDEVVRVLDNANSVDIEERANDWRSSGWDYQATNAAAAATTGIGGLGLGAMTGTTARDMDLGAAAGSREEVIPIVEEQLVVGKRDVARGGVRVRSYVTETPVHEQIRLRNERVNVERRAVDQPLSAADGDAFRERSIEMTATGEEAVVGKTARVVEEVVISKSADEQVENVEDTVRRTDVEIDHDVDEKVRSSSFASGDKRD